MSYKIKRIPALCCFLLSFLSVQSQSLTSEWLSTFGGAGIEVGQAITLDQSGNLYLTGTFENSVDFDPGPDTLQVTSNGQEDIFILKLDSAGSLVWVRQIGGPEFDNGEDIKIGKDGSVYVTGSFEGLVDFDPGPDSTLLGAAINNIFILKLTSEGNLAWAKQFESASGSINVGNEIVLGPNGDVVITGSFSSSTDFDPGPGTYNLNGGQFGDVFICRLDSTGHLKWVKKFSGYSFDVGSSVTSDAQGNTYVCGHYEYSINFDIGKSDSTFTSNNPSNSYVAKIDSSGNFSWARDIRGTQISRAFAVRADKSGNIYVGGYFDGTVDFDPGSGTYSLSSKGQSDAYILKLNPNGSFVWAKQFEGYHNVRLFDLVLDDNGILYSTGYFKGAVDFNPGPAVFNQYAGTNSPKFYLCRIGSKGDFMGVKSLGGNGVSFGRSLYCDNQSGNIYSTGNFTVELEALNSTVVSSNGADDLFIHKISQNAIGIKERSKPDALVGVYPNPSEGDFTLLVKDELKCDYRIIDIQGREIGSGKLSGLKTDLKLKTENPGVYFLHVLKGTYTFSVKLIKL